MLALHAVRLRVRPVTQPANVEQLQAKCFDLREQPVQRGLVDERTGEHGVAGARLDAQVAERQPHRLAEVTANADLVAVGLTRHHVAPAWVGVCNGNCGDMASLGKSWVTNGPAAPQASDGAG